MQYMGNRNPDILNYLFQKGKINLEHGRLFEQSVMPKPANFNFGKVEGMLLGIAIGDALGITSEGQTPGRRKERHPPHTAPANQRVVPRSGPDTHRTLPSPHSAQTTERPCPTATNRRRQNSY